MFGFCVFERTKETCTVRWRRLIACDSPNRLETEKSDSLSGFFWAKYLISQRKLIAKPDSLSGFRERIMEQNETLNAANAMSMGPCCLKWEPGFDTNKCSAIRRGVGTVLIDAISRFQRHRSRYPKPKSRWNRHSPSMPKLRYVGINRCSTLRHNRNGTINARVLFQYCSRIETAVCIS